MRLLPALVVLLVAHLVYVQIAGLGTARELKTIAVTLLYVLNWWAVLGNQFTTDLGHLWSLSVEEQFYLVWPAVVLLVIGLRRRLWIAVVALLLMLLAVMVWRWALWRSGTPTIKIHVRTDTRADGLILGALLALLWVKGLVPKRGLATAATVAFGFLVGLPISRAVRKPGPREVQAAVKRCVLGLVALDAVLAVAFLGAGGLAVLLLLPPALALGKWVYST